MPNGLPGISSPLPNDVRQFLERVGEFVTGADGNYVTKQALIDAGMAVWGSGGNLTPLPAPGGVVVDMTTPPAPTGFTVKGGMTAIYLQWDPPTSTNVAFTKVYRAEVDVWTSAEYIGMTSGQLYADPVEPATKYYYWIRFVSKADKLGPLNSQVGTYGRSGEDVSRLLTVLTGQITQTQLHSGLSTAIVKANNAAIGFEVQSGVISDLGYAYSVKIDNAGFVTGFGLSSERNNPAALPTSSFAVRADRFYVAPPSTVSESAPTLNLYKGYAWYKTSTTTTKYWDGAAWVTTAPSFPFIVQSAPIGTIDTPDYVPAGVYIDAAYIADASITTAKIHDLTADKITAGNITATLTLTATDAVTGAIKSMASGTYNNTVQPIWQISGTGLATFNNAVIRGTVYANDGLIGGNTIDATSIHSGTTGYGAGTGFYLGSNGTFSLGSNLTWDGSILRIGGSAASVIARPIYFIGDFASAPQYNQSTQEQRLQEHGEWEHLHP